MLEQLLPSFSNELLKIAVSGESECICPSARVTTCPVHGNKARVAKGMPPTTPGEDKARARRLAREKSKKAAAEVKKPSPKKRADGFHTAEVKNWPGFEEDLKSLPFQRAMLKHEATDPKLAKYVKNFGGQLKSKSVIAFSPSRTDKDREYKIKVLPTGRLACECKDWQYHHSVRKSDCDHIKAVRAIYKAGLVKTGAPALKLFAQGMKLHRKVDIAKDYKERGQRAQRDFQG
jgi:hypothetical protein